MPNLLIMTILLTFKVEYFTLGGGISAETVI